MSDRRRALIEKFQAMTRDRLTRMTVTLLELEQGQAGEAELERLTRELHTLKGESRMLGFEGVSAVAHAAEGRLHRAAQARSAGGALLTPTSGALLRRAVELVRRALSASVAPVSELRAMTAELDEEGAASPEPLPATSTRSGELTARGGAVSPERWVQVHGERIEDLCEQVTALAGQFRGLVASITDAASRAPQVPGARARALPERTVRGMLEGLDDCSAVLREVTEAAWSLRLTPVEPLLDEMSKHARELAIGLGKRVRVETSGSGVELERTIIDAVWEPVLHLVRNAVSHGVEAPDARGGKPPDATLRFGADAAGANVVLSVEDDGRGVDLERVRREASRRGLLTPDEALASGDEELLSILFSHGFSTLEVADEISGRGVGLDVVRRTVESLGGSVAIDTTPGKGTRFSLTVPTTISKEHALIVEHAGVLHGFPCRSIVEVVRLDEGDVTTDGGEQHLRFRAQLVPFCSLRDLLSLSPGAPGQDRWAVVVESAGRHMAFGVDAMLGERELLRRPVDDLLAWLDYVAASSTVEDGRVVIVFLVPGLIRRADARRRDDASSSLHPPSHHATGHARAPESAPGERRVGYRVLLVDDSAIVCELVSDLLVSAGFEVEVALGPSAALTAIAARPPDILLTDLDMPGMSGLELVSRVRADLPDLPVVILSARHAAQVEGVVASAGATAYLEKASFHKRTLVEAIESAMRRRVLTP